MSDEQPPIAPPPPPAHGPFAFPPPPDQNAGWGPPPEPSSWQSTPRGFFPLNIGRVFDLTFSLYRFRWRTLVGISLLIEVGTALAGLLLLLAPQSRLITDFSRTPTPEEINAFLATLVPTILLSLVFFVLFLVLGYIEFGAMTDAVMRIYSGRRASVLSSLRRGLRRWLTFVALMLILLLAALAILVVGLVLATLVGLLVILVGVPISLAFFLILIAYVATFAALIFVGVRWSMAIPIAVAESVGARDALGRSWRLIAGSTWRVIGYYLAFWLLVLLISVVVSTFLNILVNPYTMSGFTIVSVDYFKLAISTVLSSVLGAVVAPLTAIPALLIYLDLRFRRGDHINPPGQGSLTGPPNSDGSVSEEQL